MLLKDHAKLMQAILVSGEVIGRKKLQKMIYIAKKVDFPFHERFQFHFYGPYSEELTTRVEELCNMGFLNEVKEKEGRLLPISLHPDRYRERVFKLK